jgi:hypothetical protein
MSHSPAQRVFYRIGGFVTIIAIVVLGAIGLWLSYSPDPQPERNLFDDRTKFQAYVARMGLASVPTPSAIERLTSQGFACETFKHGNVACFREARGPTCGERQFVDLFVPGQHGAAHSVGTRFGRVCL